MVRRLKELRNAKGISQQTLAEKLGVSQQSVNKYENHDIEPDIDTLIAMADYFNVSVDYLIGRDVNPVPILSSSAQNLLSDYQMLSQEDQAHFSALLHSCANTKKK